MQAILQLLKSPSELMAKCNWARVSAWTFVVPTVRHTLHTWLMTESSRVMELCSRLDSHGSKAACQVWARAEDEELQSGFLQALKSLSGWPVVDLYMYSGCTAEVHTYIHVKMCVTCSTDGLGFRV